MPKNEVYSWRLSAETKSVLEEAARRNRSTVSELLDKIVGDWLARQRQFDEDDAAQQRLHDAALKVIGTIQGDDSNRAGNVKAVVRARLSKRRAG